MTQGLKQNVAILLVDPNTGVPSGFLGADGKEYLLPTLVANGNGTTLPRLDNVLIGQTTPQRVKASQFQCSFTDSSGTPGNVTNNSGSGRAAFAAAAQTVTVTSSLVTAGSSVYVTLGGSDATLTGVRVTTAAGSFTVTGNAAATGVTPFDFLVVN